VLALAAAGLAAAALWTGSTGSAAIVAGLSVAALEIGATFVTVFTASLADAGPLQHRVRRRRDRALAAAAIVAAGVPAVRRPADAAGPAH
jgi:hypothetical protein